MPLTRRKLVQLCAAGAAALPAHSSAARSDRPNILFLLTDQQRFDGAGAYGNRVIRTPNIDRIAREGALFRCAYSSTPTCTPARSAILTGLSPWHHGMLGMTQMAQRYPLENRRSCATPATTLRPSANSTTHPCVTVTAIIE
jgi:arylsulfatase A-like enzyme